MNNSYGVILPEIILITTACALFLLGVSRKEGTRAFIPWFALLAMVIVLFMQTMSTGDRQTILFDPSGSIRIGGMGQFIRALASGVGVLLILLAWPTDPSREGNSALYLGSDSGEFFALMLLSITGIF